MNPSACEARWWHDPLEYRIAARPGLRATRDPTRTRPANARSHRSSRVLPLRHAFGRPLPRRRDRHPGARDLHLRPLTAGTPGAVPRPEFEARQDLSGDGLSSQTESVYFGTNARVRK